MIFGKFLKENKIAVCIFLLAVIVRLALFFMYLNANHGDFVTTIWGADGYTDTAENLVLGNGYSEEHMPPFTPSSLRPPLWIFIIALFTGAFGSYIPIFLFQLALSSFIPILGMSFAGRILSPPYPPIVGFLLALEPAAVFSTTMLATEISFTFFFLMFVLFLFRYFDRQTARNIIWSGVFLGLSILIKPTVQFLPILIPAGLLYLYRKNLSARLLRHCAFFAVVSMLVVAPWIYRNKVEFGVFGISSQPAYNLYTVLVPTVLSIDTGTRYLTEEKTINQTIDVRTGGIDLSNSQEYINKSLSILSQHKLAFVKSILISIVTFFTHDHMLTVLGYGGVTIPNFLDKPAVVLLTTHPLELMKDILLYVRSPGIIVLLARLFWILVTALFFFGAGAYFRKEKFSAFAASAVLLVAYFAVTTTANGFGMNGRFRIPVNPFIFIFAVYGFFAVWKKVAPKLRVSNE